MGFFEFVVNSRLELQDWNDQFEGMGNGPKGLKGRPYYELNFRTMRTCVNILKILRFFMADRPEITTAVATRPVFEL